jgi:oxygen-independent coproporphyrinogen-3 oxidase
LEEKGYARYEISNFAKKGFESRHNMNYWRRGEYIGFGVAASSFMRGKRFTNTFDLDEYMKCIISGFYPAVDCEEVDEKDAKFEFVMLALRTKEGIDPKEYEKEFGSKLSEDFPHALEKTERYLHEDNGRICIKDEYLYVQNSVLMYFMEEPREIK